MEQGQSELRTARYEFRKFIWKFQIKGMIYWSACNIGKGIWNKKLIILISGAWKINRGIFRQGKVFIGSMEKNILKSILDVSLSCGTKGALYIGRMSGP